MQTDAEHEENDADFGKLWRKVLIRHKAGRIGADQNAGDEVAHQRRKTEAMRNRAKNKRQHEAPDQG